MKPNLEAPEAIKTPAVGRLSGREGPQGERVAIVIPCFNEEMTVGKVVRDFARVLPDAEIFVFDNASTDRTAEVAREAGAQVVFSPRRGKGSVIQHMARVVDADIYVLVDGDDTYPAAAAPALIEQFWNDGVDMLVATRLREHEAGAFRPFHVLGNQLVAKLISLLFGVQLTDVLSGYRVLSRELVKVVCLRSRGFEIETELTLQALTKNFAVKESPVPYRPRPEGSYSKLSTWSDGLLILKCIFLILKDYKPLLFFSLVAALLALASLASGVGPVLEFYQTGLVLRIPRAILAAGLGILAAVSFVAGLILDTVHRYHTENVEFWRRFLRERP
jgi:glycosyltransferase involved in cell wall biosynthesis